MKEYDVAIIGAGSAGSTARREVHKKTKNYCVIDNGILGTTCARVGCMPSKVFIQAANDFKRREKLKEQGINGGESLTLDTVQLMKHVRKLRDRFVRAVMSGVDTWASEHLIRKKASFIDDHTLDLGDEKIKAKSIIIANGSRPVLPENFKAVEKYCVTTDEFFEMDDLPKSIAVIGIGVIGIELGQALSNLGIETLILGRRKIIAGMTDPEINMYVANKFEEQMNICFSDCQNVEEVDGKVKLTLPHDVFTAEKILMVAGRESNIDNLNLENTSVKLNPSGLPEFSKETFLAEGTKHIFFAGDVTGEKAILHEAADEGRIAGYNSVRLDKMQGFKTRVPLAITFSDPNLAIVGKGYRDLENSDIDFAVGQVSFEGQGRSIVKLKEIGMLRLYGEKKTGKILGAEIFAPEGEHLAHLISWVIEMDLTVNQMLSLPYYHPVVEEGLRTAVRELKEKCHEEAPPLEIYPI
jgi:dihydrolipoamide dehydrogenase